MLPLELIKHICSYLPLSELVKIRLLNRDCDCIVGEFDAFIKWKDGLKQWKNNITLEYDKNLCAMNFVNRIYSKKYLNPKEQFKYFKIVYQLCGHLFDPNAIFMATCRMGNDTITKYIYYNNTSKISCLEQAIMIANKCGNMELLVWIQTELQRQKVKQQLLPFDYDIFCYILKFVPLKVLAILSNVSKSINCAIKNDPYYSFCVQSYAQCGKFVQCGKLRINTMDFAIKLISAKTSEHFNRFDKEFNIAFTAQFNTDIFVSACKYGHIDIVLKCLNRFLLHGAIQIGFDEACKGGHLGIVNLLIDYPSRENIIMPSTNIITPPIFWAVCANGYLDIARILIQRYPYFLQEYNCSVAFQRACANGHTYIVLWLIDLWTINRKFQLRFESDDILKKFQNACTKGYIGIAKILKDLYPEVICGMKLFESLVKSACENNHSIITEWLLEMCPEINLHMDDNYLFKNIYKYNRKIQDLLERNK